MGGGQGQADDGGGQQVRGEAAGRVQKVLHEGHLLGLRSDRLLEAATPMSHAEVS